MRVVPSGWEKEFAPRQPASARPPTTGPTPNRSFPDSRTSWCARQWRSSAKAGPFPCFNLIAANQGLDFIQLRQRVIELGTQALRACDLLAVFIHDAHLAFQATSNRVGQKASVLASSRTG